MLFLTEFLPLSAHSHFSGSYRFGVVSRMSWPVFQYYFIWAHMSGMLSISAFAARFSLMFASSLHMTSFWQLQYIPPQWVLSIALWHVPWHCVVTGAVPEQLWMMSYCGLEMVAKLLWVQLPLSFVCLSGLKPLNFVQLKLFESLCSDIYLMWFCHKIVLGHLEGYLKILSYAQF